MFALQNLFFQETWAVLKAGWGFTSDIWGEGGTATCVLSALVW